MSLKALASAVLKRNQTGNTRETKSFLPAPEGMLDVTPKETFLSAHELTPSQRSLWCLEHELIAGHTPCPYKKSLSGCTLWGHIVNKNLLTVPQGARYG